MTSATNLEREREWWDAKAAKEDQDHRDEAINRALRWREIERRLEGVETILSVGGGTGAFTIPLARRGYQVTHLDISPAMLEIARQRAGSLPNLNLLEGSATDLSRFPDRFFDLVLNMDGAISFCGDQAERALLESCRVTRRTILVTVSHRAWMIPVWLSSSITATGRVLPAVQAMFDTGSWHQDAFPDNALLTQDSTQGYFGAFKAFLPDELRYLLETAEMRVLRCGGLGSLSNLMAKLAASRMLADEGLTAQLVELCDRYDHEIAPEGIGTAQRAGLIAVAERVLG